MPLITWKLPDGSQRQAQAADGDNLMMVATFEGIPSIDGDCGGCLSCATCHVIVDPAWVKLIGGPSESEAAMLEATTSPRQPHSRLSCQIVARPELDGLVLIIPAA